MSKKELVEILGYMVEDITEGIKAFFLAVAVLAGVYVLTVGTILLFG